MEILNDGFWHHVSDTYIFCPPKAPDLSLQYLKSLNSEIPFKFTEEQMELLCGELEKDFTWLDIFYYKKQQGLYKSLTTEEIIDLKSVLHWIINQLNGFNIDNGKIQKLEEITIGLLIIGYLDDNIWRFLENKIHNKHLEEFLPNRLANYHINFKFPQDLNIAIWEKESIQLFQQFVTDKDWFKIANNWHIFRNLEYSYYDILQIQILKFSLTFSKNQLLASLDKYNDFFMLMMYSRVENIALSDRLYLAKVTSNSFFRFALLISLELRKDIVLDDSQSEILAEVFQEIAKDKSLSFEWFKIFNHFLIRYNFFASAFGIFLAKYADDIDMDNYLASLGEHGFSCNPKHGLSDDREILTSVFKAFELLVDGDKRKVFWEKVYKKYLDVGLLGIDGNDFKNNIHYSIFDYAVVSYWLENKNSDEWELKVNNLNQDLENLGMRWFESQSDMISEYYRLLSLFQPLYNAQFVANGDYEFKLQEMERSYTPSLINEDARLKLMIGLES